MTNDIILTMKRKTIICLAGGVGRDFELYHTRKTTRQHKN